MQLLSKEERCVARELARLKQEAGSHSPSVETIVKDLGIKITIDACFLSNPWATELFLEYFQRELIDSGGLRDRLEFYPSQNHVIARVLANYLRLDPATVFIGNGASEVIQAVLHRFCVERILINLPTFSPYYEFVSGKKIIYNCLEKDNNYALDIDRLLEVVRSERIDTVVVVNPNNPDGNYLPFKDVYRLLEELKRLPLVIVDESFIHFAREEDDYSIHSCMGLVNKYPNLVVIKSMSKDFGIAGIRAGYGVMNAGRVASLLKDGYLWNSSGLSEYFFRLFSRPDFQVRYESIRIRFIYERDRFYQDLNRLPFIKVIPSMANFYLVELLNGLSAEDVMYYLLLRHGVYVRGARDKKGLENGQYIRVALRKPEENCKILEALSLVEERSHSYSERVSEGL